MKAQTQKQRKAAERKAASRDRYRAQGLKEVTNLWAPPEYFAKIRKFVESLKPKDKS